MNNTQRNELGEMIGHVDLYKRPSGRGNYEWMIGVRVSASPAHDEPIRIVEGRFGDRLTTLNGFTGSVGTRMGSPFKNVKRDAERAIRGWLGDQVTLSWEECDPRFGATGVLRVKTESQQPRYPFEFVPEVTR